MTSKADYVSDYRRKIRRKAVAFLGGQCVKCGSLDRLEIDHIIPTKNPRNGMDYYQFHRKIITGEVTGVQLLCNPCHIEKSRQELMKKST